MAWIKEVEHARWQSPADIRRRYASASFVSDKVVFNIGGNKYRLVIRLLFADLKRKPPHSGIAFILFIGTHDDYDRIDVAAL